MGKAVNQVFLLGRLTKDVELRSTTTGKSVASFSLAVDKGSEDTNFFDVTAWEKLADLLDKYVGKGSKVLVQGSLEQQTWEKDGNKRSKVIVVARDVTFLDSPQDRDTGTNTNQVVEPEDDVDLSEIPF